MEAFSSSLFSETPLFHGVRSLHSRLLRAWHKSWAATALLPVCIPAKWNQLDLSTKRASRMKKQDDSFIIWLWNQIPLKFMMLLIILCLLSKDSYYPFSSFAMYSSFSKTTALFFVKDSSGELVALSKAGITGSQMMKYFHTVERDLRKHKYSHSEARRQAYVRTLDNVYRKLVNSDVPFNSPLTLMKRFYRWSKATASVHCRNVEVLSFSLEEWNEHERMRIAHG